MKQIANSYAFDAATRRVTITGITIPQARLLLIANATLGQIIYNFAAQGMGATAYQSTAGNTVVTLAFDTTTHANNHQLTIYYDDGLGQGDIVAQAEIEAIGATDDGSTNAKTGAWTAISLLKGIFAALFDKLPALTLTGRVPVDIGGVSISVQNEVEVKNDEGSPVPVSGPITNAQLRDAPLAVTGVSALLVSATGVIGESSEEVLSSSATRRYLFIQNISASPIHVNFGAAATTSNPRLDAGASFVFEGNFCPRNSIHLLGVAADQKYCILYFNQ
jgi:hypothetical protein